MRRRSALFLAGILIVVLGAFGVTVALGSTPILGLDLQGGISVVLVPDEDEVESESLDVAVDIIRSRVDALGVAEPEVARQGNRIIVDLPGVREREQAAEAVGQTAELRFRAVDVSGGVEGCLPPEEEDPEAEQSETQAPAEEPGDDGAPDGGDTTGESPDDGAPEEVEDPGAAPTTPRDEDLPDRPVVLEGLEPCLGEELPRYALGPTLLTGEALDTARSEFISGQGFVVTVDFTGEGGRQFVDQVAAPNVGNRVSIVLDGVVQSAPVIQPDVVTGGGRSVQITGDFSESDARSLATVLRFGALPVQLETETIQDVSPTLGADQLRAGLAAGAIGLLLVALYMFVYYRAFALVAIGGLALTGMWTYALVSYLGDVIGLTLTLAGVTGLIVAVGITVDSYIVYFERLKEEVRTGKTLRSSLQRGFERSWRTILAADIAALIGAAILYWLAIGSVRGFALFLGIATLLDLIITFFFMHPMTVVLTRSRRFMGPRFGLGAALGRPELEA